MSAGEFARIGVVLLTLIGGVIAIPAGVALSTLPQLLPFVTESGQSGLFFVGAAMVIVGLTSVVYAAMLWSVLTQTERHFTGIAR